MVDETTAAAASGTAPAPGATETAAPGTSAPPVTLANETTPLKEVEAPPKEGEKKEGEAPKEADKAAAFDPKGLTLPEGFTPDEGMMTSFQEIINDPKLSKQELGTKLVGMYADAVKKVGEANTKAFTDLSAKWVNEIKADPEIGGVNLDGSKALISKAIDSLGPDRAKAFREGLDVTGAGNNPAIVRGLVEMGKALSEGTPVTGSPGAQKKGIAETFFPNSPGMKD